MTFTWLHISDLHAGMRDEAYLFPTVRKQLFGDLDYLVEKTGPIDLVLFTGDLAFRGSAEEYKKVDEILNRVCDKLKTLTGNSPCWHVFRETTILSVLPIPPL